MIRGHRLSGVRAFRAVRARRAGASVPGLRVEVAPNQRERARVGLVVPKAVGGAVVRNRVKRRLRAVLRPQLPALAGLDVVVVAGRPLLDRSHLTLTADVARCLGGARRQLDA